jgi:hypothetical protein
LKLEIKLHIRELAEFMISGRERQEATGKRIEENFNCPRDLLQELTGKPADNAFLSSCWQS